MLQRLYVHNFRCFENFEFKIGDSHSALLIGKNGTGKSTVAKVLTVLQSIGRGTNRVGDLVSPRDFCAGRSEVPIRFEIELSLDGRKFVYSIALELPEKFKELRVLEERLEVDGKSVFNRNQATVALAKGAVPQADAQFSVDWHVVALSLIQTRPKDDPVHALKSWLAHMVILAPYPKAMSSTSTDETLYPTIDGSNIGDWLTGLLSLYPASYATIDKHLRGTMPDIKDFFNEPIGKDAKRLLVNFAAQNKKLSLSFEDLSDGEKCFFLCAVILAANSAYGPILCFWDEPDNYLSLSEVGFFVRALRSSFESSGQLLMTSHNEEAIRAFSDENTWVVDRKNHLEPTLIRRLDELGLQVGLIPALISGDIEL